MSDFLHPDEADIPPPRDPREAHSIEVAWECMKIVSMPEQFLWLADDGWLGAWHVTAERHPQGYLLRSHRHTLATFDVPLSLN